MRLLLIAFIILFPFTSQARKFYISSSTGNDSRTATQAQNIATPWQNLQKVEQWANTPGNAQPGDTFAFKRGDVFTNGYSWYSSFHWMNYAPEGYQEIGRASCRERVSSPV